MKSTVGVIGLGTMGSMALWQMASRGIDVVGFEQFGLGHQDGAFSGETRMFRTAYANGAHWTPALVAARALWRELERQAGLPLLDMNGFVSIASAGADGVQRLIASAADSGAELVRLDAEEARRRFPALGLLADETAVFDPAGGLIKPERAVMAALCRAQELGARVKTRCRVTAIEPGPDGVTIRTDDGPVEVGHVVVTTGAWASDLLGRELVSPHRVALHWYLAKTPALFAPEVFPSHIRYVGGRSICLFSSQDGTMVKAAIGGSLGELAGPLDARTADAPEADELSAAIARFYPDLWPEPVRSASYADGFTPDRDAVIGRVGDGANVIVAAGFSAHGFKIAPVVGAALADLVQTGATSQPLEHLKLDRFAAPPPSAFAGSA